MFNRVFPVRPFPSIQILDGLCVLFCVLFLHTCVPFFRANLAPFILQNIVEDVGVTDRPQWWQMLDKTTSKRCPVADTLQRGCLGQISEYQQEDKQDNKQCQRVTQPSPPSPPRPSSNKRKYPHHDWWQKK